MNKNINPIWVGVAAVTVVLIAALAYANWNLEILKLPYVWMYLIAMALLTGLYVYRAENPSKYLTFIRRYYIFPIFYLFIAVICIILFLIGGL